MIDRLGIVHPCMPVFVSVSVSDSGKVLFNIWDYLMIRIPLEFFMAREIPSVLLVLCPVIEGGASKWKMEPGHRQSKRDGK
jgi:hypothetical protein